MYKCQSFPKSVFFPYNSPMFASLEHLHHSIILIGNRVVNLDLVKNYFSEQGIVIQANPDVVIFDTENLGIDIVRDHIVPLVTAQKISKARCIVLSFDRATIDAQNALLKSIEEPQAGTYFFILVPTIESILSTIVSRSQIISGNQTSGETRLDVSKFLNQTLSGRFAMVEEWTKNKKEEHNLSKTEIVNFLDQIEKFLWDRKNRDEQLFADIRQMREYANIRGASHRVILDYVAMIAPVVK